jgi:hypothetical protein
LLFCESVSNEFCRHNPLCCFSTSSTIGKRIFLCRLSPETFGYTLVYSSETLVTFSGAAEENVKKFYMDCRENVNFWRRLHNEELHNIYASLNIIKAIKSRMRWARHVARVRQMRNEHSIFVIEPEVKRPLRRARCRWEDNIRMDLREVGWEGVDWLRLRIASSGGLLRTRS